MNLNGVFRFLEIEGGSKDRINAISVSLLVLINKTRNFLQQLLIKVLRFGKKKNLPEFGVQKFDLIVDIIVATSF